jgi:hypothetical protein
MFDKRKSEQFRLLNLLLFSPSFVAVTDLSAVWKANGPVANDWFRQPNIQRIHLRWSLGKLQEILDCSGRSLQVINQYGSMKLAG